jgi:phosphate transport system protein
MTTVATTPFITTNSNRAVTRHRFDDQLEAVRQQMLTMLEQTETMLDEALETLFHPDGTPDRANSVFKGDDTVDYLNVQTEQDCLRLLTLQQPVVATDLRFVGSALKIVDDIERIGDQSVNIAKTAERLRKEGRRYAPLADVEAMSAQVQAMLSQTKAAYTVPDTVTARAVIQADADVDTRYAEIKRIVQARMQAEPCQAVLGSHLLFVAHYLERIGDHCVGIAERILYLKTGIEKEAIR